MHPQQLLQQQQLMRQRSLMMNGLAGGNNPGINPESRQVARGFLPNGMIAGAGGNPQNPGMGGFPGGPPHMRGPQLLPPHLQQVRSRAYPQPTPVDYHRYMGSNIPKNFQVANAHQVQQQQIAAAQQLALANQGVNAQAAGQAMGMQQQPGNMQNPTAQQQMNMAHAAAAAQAAAQQRS